jgi:cell division septation protein DedD
MLSEDRANTLAAAIKVDGKPVRVVPSTREGTAVFRVVFGPFDSREEAERTGRRTGLPFWVYEGAP